MAEENDSGGGESFGFDAGTPKKDEKYNTRYLVSSMQRDTRTSRFVIGGIMGALVLGVLLWLAMGGSPSHEPAAGTPSQAEAAPNRPAAASAPPAKTDEAKSVPVPAAAAPKEAGH